MQNQLQAQSARPADQLAPTVPSISAVLWRAGSLGSFLLTASCLLSLLSPTVSAAPKTLLLTEQGLGPISAKTAFKRSAVQSLLPGLSVKDGQDQTEGEFFPILQISDSLGVIATISSSQGERAIFNIVVRSNRIKNKLGHGIGAKYSAIYASGSAVTCHPGAEEEFGTVFCLAPRSRHVYYQFESKTYHGIGDTVPPESELRSWTVKLIYWRP